MSIRNLKVVKVMPPLQDRYVGLSLDLCDVMGILETQGWLSDETLPKDLRERLAKLHAELHVVVGMLVGKT